MKKESIVVSGTMRRIALSFALATMAFYNADTVQGATIYVYKNARGSALITDHPREVSGYRLVKRYGSNENDTAADDDFTAIRPIVSAFDDMIDRASQNTGLDVALVKAVIHAESAFDPEAVSHKGAVGLMQLMATTASAYGVTNRSDPWQNLMGGTTHLKELIDRYRDTSLALAAYNAGIDAVRRHGGIPPYAETRTYVRKVLHLHELYRQQG